jgi:hypothetical protein
MNACGKEDDNSDNTPMHNCGTAYSIDTFKLGMQKTTQNEHFTITLSAASPAPPDIGDNNWTIAVVDQSSNALESASITLTPFMPEHGHGTSPADFNGVATDTAGTYSIEDFPLTMSGIWQITINVDNSSKNDDAVFTFCAEG